MRKNKKYSPEFKISCIIEMREQNLGYLEACRKFFNSEKGKESNDKSKLKLWERIFLEEGEAGLFIERRGRKTKMDNPKIGRPKKVLDKQIEDDLIAENQRLRERLEDLEMENEYLKKLDALVRKRLQDKKEKVIILSELRQKYDLNKLLKYSNIPRSTYYYHANKLAKPDKYAVEKQEILDIFNHNKGRYGYRRVLLVLNELGYIINHKTVLKLMKSLGLKGKQRKNKYKSYKGDVGKIAPNIINRDFKANKPYEKLATDVTEFAVCDEKVYLSPILDMYNNEILSYSISTSPNFCQTREILNELIKKLPKNAKPILHSDQGWQYQMKEYQRILKQNNIIQSMSRKGNCLDNSVMENFFGRLKTEMFFGEKFESVNTFIDKLKEYIYYYNNERKIIKLKMSPVEYRTHNQSI